MRNMIEYGSLFEAGALSLVPKIAKAIVSVEGIVKSGYNTHDNYGYAPSDEIMKVCGRALASQGVIVVPTIREIEVLSDKQKPFEVLLSVEYLITDGESSIKIMWVGGGQNYRTIDKAIKVAMTNCQSQFLAKFMNVGTEESDTEDGSAEEQPRQPQRSPQPQRAPQSPPAPSAPMNYTNGHNGSEKRTTTPPATSNGTPEREIEPTPEKKKLVEQIEVLALQKWTEEDWNNTQRAYNVNRLAPGAKNIFQLTVDELTRFRDGLARMLGVSPETGEKKLTEDELAAAAQKLAAANDNSDQRLKLLQAISEGCGSLRPEQDVEESAKMIASAHSSLYSDETTDDIVELETEDLVAIAKSLSKDTAAWSEWLKGVGDSFSYPLLATDVQK